MKLLGKFRESNSSSLDAVSSYAERQLTQTDPNVAKTALHHGDPRSQACCTARSPPSSRRACETNAPRRFSKQVLVDTTPLPDSVPKVQEIGASSAPLMSASFFIGARCKPYNDDYMVCKTEANGRGELECLREGRKVTRCAASVLDDVSKHCLAEFRAHWQCLERNNQQMWNCRGWERPLNKCVFDNLVCVSPVLFFVPSRTCSRPSPARSWKRSSPARPRARCPCTCARSKSSPRPGWGGRGRP
ncbi:MAG: coiled-coil-helix-coiled-coil-helix domain-containing protein [Terriglobus roseus]|nr:coiled-coil-helix-coiled-coil-helix domain-containing protein [Terriglobus roseus]